MKHQASVISRFIALLCAFLLLCGCSAAVDPVNDGLPAEPPVGTLTERPDVTYVTGSAEAEAPAGYTGETKAAASSTSLADAGSTVDGDMRIDTPVSGEPAPGSDYLPDPSDPTVLPKSGDAGVLTAAEWNDNDNWPFFTNLVNAQTIRFPSFGIDPRNRVRVNVVDEAGTPLPYETVTLRSGERTLWTAKSDRNGVACLFFWEDVGETCEIVVGDTEQTVALQPVSTDPQSVATAPQEEVTVVTAQHAVMPTSLQVMFIVDTTGSMCDEIAYLQKDFSSIAGDIGAEGVSYSVCFYRDEGDDYVTKCNDFTSDVSAVQTLLNAEYAEGGGDTPEAVAQILDETLIQNTQWRDDAVKIAFLIFDAPPHEGNDAILQAAIRTAAEKGIILIPVVASNADRETELFGRAIAICTNGTYVFLTDDSGVGDSHLEPIVGTYTVELLHDLIVRIIERYRP